MRPRSDTVVALSPISEGTNTTIVDDEEEANIQDMRDVVGTMRKAMGDLSVRIILIYSGDGG